ncbi:MAG: lytic transglycosylase domain-containing protein [Rhodoferax sp.]|nr:lytic transglycosylase domain-containing protein [Rhodoferax sp.]
MNTSLTSLTVQLVGMVAVPVCLCAPPVADARVITPSWLPEGEAGFKVLLPGTTPNTPNTPTGPAELPTPRMTATVPTTATPKDSQAVATTQVTTNTRSSSPKKRGTPQQLCIAQSKDSKARTCTVSGPELHRQILRAAAIHDLDPDLVKAVVWAESRFDPQAISPKRAIGLMQVLPSTASAIGFKPVDDTPLEHLLQDPWVSLLVGTRYLARQLAYFGGRTELALAAYNAGPGAVERAGMRVPNYPETQAYVRQVMAFYAATKALRKSGSAPV